MSTIWYWVNADKIEKKKLDTHDKKERQSRCDMSGISTQYFRADSPYTRVDIWLRMFAELFICVTIDLTIIACLLWLFF